MRSALALALLSCSLLPACATIDRGTTDFVRVDSVPQGATVTMIGDNVDAVMDDEESAPVTKSCTTPCALPFGRQTEVLVRIERDGFAPFEYAVTPSRLRGSGGTNAAKSAAVTTGVSAATGFFVASFGNGIANLFTLGTAGTVYNTTGAAVSGTGVGLGLTAASMAIDASAGANMNFFPNPTVVGLAEAGQETQIDPLVAPLRRLIELEERQRAFCNRGSGNYDRERCKETRNARRAARKDFREMRKTRDDEIVALMEAARAEGAN